MNQQEGFDSSANLYPLCRFCPDCGGGLTARALPAEEHRERLVCAVCGRIHYINPKVVAAVLPVRAGRVLLLRRAFEPRARTWVFPGGFVEWGETTEQAAAREAREETGVSVEIGPVLGVYNRVGPGVVIVVYHGQTDGANAAPGREALELAWFTPAQLPWSTLAFDTTEAALRDWAVHGAPV